MPGWSAELDPLPSAEPALNTDVSIHDQGRDPASLVSCDSPGDELVDASPLLNSEFVELMSEYDEGRDYSQCIVPIKSNEVTPSESLIPPGTDLWICRFIDDVTVMINGAEDMMHTNGLDDMMHTKSSPGDESNPDFVEPTSNLDEGRES